MVLMDEMGKKIHASVKKNLVPKFEDLIEEGNAYLLSNFGVAENSVRYPMAKHDYKINFYRYTKVKICTLFSGSMYGFEFASFRDILAGNSDTKHPVDVIGDLFSCGELDDYSKNGKVTKRISFELADLEGEKIKCTL